MKISFNIDYRTNWGESVYLSGNIPELGNGDESQAIKLNLNGNEAWSIEIDIADSTPDFQYHYFIKHENGYTKKEAIKKAAEERGVPKRDVYNEYESSI